MKNKKIILGLSGGIACYKAVELLRLLRLAGALVQVVMTTSALEFITPLTLQALSGRPVRDTLFGLEAENAMSHIELARWADMILIAPASANRIAKLAHGIADDLLTTLCLATKSPIAIVPAMNVVMWENELTQKNIHILNEQGFIIYGPAKGEQACGDMGFGRMLEPKVIFEQVLEYWQSKKLTGKKIMITAGPTREALDPVRYFTNYSSGKMGYCLAEAAVQQGAEVTLISGPTQLLSPNGVRFVGIQSANEMREAVFSSLDGIDIFIGAAAVADYTPKVVAKNKLKKTGESLTIELLPNPDILFEVSHAINRPACVVGFAAESENLEQNAAKKLMHKRLDFIVANDICAGKIFGADENAVTILRREGDPITLTKASKQQIARQIISILT